MRGQRGFSLLELVVSVALTIVVLAAVFAAIDPAHGAFAVEPEVADMQQRLRVAAQALAADLVTAGAPPGTGTAPALAVSALHAPGFPAVLPYRVGPLDAEPPSAARDDLITVISVPAAAAETTIEQAILAPAAAATVAGGAGCPLAGAARDPACGLRSGAVAMVRDEHGFDLFTVTGVSGSTVSLEQVRGALVRPFERGSRIVEVAITTYYLRSEDDGRSARLMRYNGRNSDAAVVDNVVALTFEYVGDAAGGPSAQETILAADVAMNPQRIVRRVRVRLRVQAAADSLRGPAGALFVHGGSARRPARWVPDLETRIDIGLRNAGLSQ